MTHIILPSNNLYFYDVLVSHLPPGTPPSAVEDADRGALKYRVWVRKIPAGSVEEAGQKAVRFVLRSGVSHARVVACQLSMTTPEGKKQEGVS